MTQASPSVVITGAGILSAIGRDRDRFAAALREGRCGIDVLRHIPASDMIRVGAELGPFTLADHLGQMEGVPEPLQTRAKKASARAPLGIQAAIGAVLEAWLAAGLSEDPPHPDRIGLIIGGQNLTRSLYPEAFAKFQKNPAYVSPRYALEFLDTNHVGALSEVFGIRGEGFATGGASASGNVALIKGYQMIRAGIADICVVVGALPDLSPLELQGFYNVGALGGKTLADRPKEACRPFDRDHEGFIFGQAAVCLILESDGSAAHRGVKAEIELAGGTILLDGNRLTDPSVAGETAVMRAVIDQAGLRPEDVDYLNSHGTSSPLGDRTEVEAIRRVFGDHAKTLWINATKGLTGHCLFAAGAVEALATVIQMEGGFVHPNLNLERPIDEVCRFAGRTSETVRIRIALNNSFGFGGINTCTLFKKR